MAVKIRLKKMGRKHRPFFRVCAMDCRSPRDGRVIEELGHYDPMVSDTDARAVLKGERIAYWLGVGAQPTPKVGVLIKKYGKDGSHLDKQAAALEKLGKRREAAIEVAKTLKAPAPKPEEPAATEEAPADAEATATEEATTETATEEAPAAEAAPEATAEATEKTEE